MLIILKMKNPGYTDNSIANPYYYIFAPETFTEIIIRKN